MNVAVIGASDKPEHYSKEAIKRLIENEHVVFPVHPHNTETIGIKVYSSIRDVRDPLDTVTLYVSRALSSQLQQDILDKKPRRIIFNPGVKSEALEKKAQEAGIEVLHACTILMLKTDQF